MRGEGLRLLVSVIQLPSYILSYSKTYVLGIMCKVEEIFTTPCVLFMKW